MKTVLLCLRAEDRRAELLREVHWLVGDALAPVSHHLQGSESGAELRAAIADARPALVALVNDRPSPLGGWGGLVPRLVPPSPAPVYVVPRPGPGREVGPAPARILVPLDGTERTAQVLPLVEEVALRHGSQVVLARVEREGLNRPMLALQMATQRLEATLEPWRERLERRGIPTTSVAAHGRPAPRILSLAARHRADLIATTTSCRRGLWRWLDPSVCRRILRRAPLPVLVQPAAEEA